MMKKLVFIDNDGQDRAEEDSRTIQRRLSCQTGLTDKFIDSMKVVADFRFMNRDKQFELLFNPENAIVTFSMYTATHYNSLGQIILFLNGAANSGLKDHVYIDGSGELPEALERALRNTNVAYGVMQAIENNYIIICDYDHPDDFYRLRIDLKGYWENPFRQESVKLKDILKKK